MLERSRQQLKTRPEARRSRLAAPPKLICFVRLRVLCAPLRCGNAGAHQGIPTGAEAPPEDGHPPSIRVPAPAARIIGGTSPISRPLFLRGQRRSPDQSRRSRRREPDGTGSDRVMSGPTTRRALSKVWSVEAGSTPKGRS